MVALRVERKGGIEAGQGFVEALKLLFRARAPDQRVEIIGAKRQSPLIAGDRGLGALRRQHQIAAIVPGLRRAGIGAKGGLERRARVLITGERQQGRAAIVQGAGMVRLALQRAVIGGDGLLQSIEALQKIAAIDVGVAKKAIEPDRLVEEFERAVAMAEIAQDEGARPERLRIGRIEAQRGVIGGDRLIEPSGRAQQIAAIIEQRRLFKAEAQGFVEAGERLRTAELLQGRAAIGPSLRVAGIEGDGAVEPGERRPGVVRGETNQSGEVGSLRPFLFMRRQRAEAGEGGGVPARLQMLDGAIEGGVDGGFRQNALRAAAPMRGRGSTSILFRLKGAVHGALSSEMEKCLRSDDRPRGVAELGVRSE